ncbi:MAG: hypothetical protein SP4CHLAM5_08920 [Chlamydiia bacterium]|nr:hypothetical protein [Chlamydiia bacterium]MCH9618755.1 hypothetical protein [Chlamydiia bacterium]MCH9624444.1 hypothetical protein [Chlamydiia bacterium]
MSDINPPAPITPGDPNKANDPNVGKKPTAFEADGPSGKSSKPGTFGKGGVWFPNMTPKEKKELNNNLCQSISYQIGQQKKAAAKAARKLKASEEGKDPDDVQ